ncbi:MAG: hypothetical protein ACRD5L_03545 [Bryobacteraceae bacterium]
MSKSLNPGLTGSGKKRVRPSRPKRRPQPKSKTNWLDALDAAHERCARIETLAGLLNACSDPEAMDARLAGRAGYFIEEDLRQVKALLAELEKGRP